MNDVKSLQILEARVAKLERAARRWMAGFFAVCVLAVGMGAKFAVMDAEFGVVKASKFVFVDSKGTPLGHIGVSVANDGSGEYASMLVTEQTKKKAVSITPGREPLVVNNP